MEKQQGGSRENAGRKRTQNIRVFLTVSPETEKALKEFKERWQTTFPKSKTGYVKEIDERLLLMLKTDAISLAKQIVKQNKQPTPKPITEGFLIGLGFKKTLGFRGWVYFSNDKIELSRHLETNEYMFTFRSGIQKEFIYQHQIENLLSALK